MSIKLALLGAWHVHAAHHLEDCRANPQTEMAVVWDSNPELGRAFALKHGLPFEADLSAVLARDDITAVVVDTATAEHPFVIGAALDAGKHVFTEKVLAITTADAEDLVAKARAKNLILRVSLQRLIEAPIQTVKRLLDAGAIGTITASRVRYAHHGAVGTPWIPAHFFDRAQAGGGALIDLGAHPFYLGMLFHDARPQSVFTTTSHVSGLDVEDNAVSILEYPGGVIAVAETSFVAGFFAYSVEIVGTGGTIAVGPADNRVMVRSAGTTEWLEQDLVPALPSTFDQFVSALMGQPPADTDHLDTAVWVTRIVEAAYTSSAEARKVALTDG